MLKEFKEFAVRGNVVDMAVGIIIGAAFGKIVDLGEPISRAIACATEASWDAVLGGRDDA